MLALNTFSPRHESGKYTAPESGLFIYSSCGLGHQAVSNFMEQFHATLCEAGKQGGCELNKHPAAASGD